MREKTERDEAGAYRHRAEVVGAVDGDSPELEHRDAATGDAESRNELDPRERNQRPLRGPTTHDSLREVESETRRDG